MTCWWCPSQGGSPGSNIQSHSASLRWDHFHAIAVVSVPLKENGNYFAFLPGQVFPSPLMREREKPTDVFPEFTFSKSLPYETSPEFWESSSETLLAASTSLAPACRLLPPLPTCPHLCPHPSSPSPQLPLKRSREQAPLQFPSISNRHFLALHDHQVSRLKNGYCFPGQGEDGRQRK